MIRKKLIGCVYNEKSDNCHIAATTLTQKYPNIECVHLQDLQYASKNYQCIITIGGDGLMLKVLHQLVDNPIDIYGINLGSIGFLLNDYSDSDILTSIANANRAILHPLEMRVTDSQGMQHTALAINEVSIMRQTCQTAKLQIKIDGKIRLDHLTADGVLLSTPAGSTAYNSAVGGPIVPLNADVLLLTPISVFRPRRWSGAVLASNSVVEFTNLAPTKRPINAVADSVEIQNVVHTHVIERKDICMTILFDKHNSLQERILKEQFE